MQVNNDTIGEDLYLERKDNGKISLYENVFFSNLTDSLWVSLRGRLQHSLYFGLGADLKESYGKELRRLGKRK